MKNWIVPCLLSAGLAAGAVYMMTGGDVAALSSGRASDARMLALEDQIEELRKALASRPLAEPAVMPTVRISPSDIEDAVARLLATPEFADRLAKKPAGAVAGAGAASEEAAPGESLDLDQALAILRDPTSSRKTRENLWRELREAGLIDGAIDSLQELIEGDPTNAELHAMLGTPLIEKLFGTKNELEKGMIAMQADAAFDQTLALDGQHWDARFSKAISLSFWPPIMGKGPEAVSQFEQLISQQEAKGDLQPQYADTYMYLGNLYQQQGKADLAKQAWKTGAMLFPNHAGLKGQLGN